MTFFYFGVRTMKPHLPSVFPDHRDFKTGMATQVQSPDDRALPAWHSKESSSPWCGSSCTSYQGHSIHPLRRAFTGRPEDPALKLLLNLVRHCLPCEHYSDLTPAFVLGAGHLTAPVAPSWGVGGAHRIPCSVSNRLACMLRKSIGRCSRKSL